MMEWDDLLGRERPAADATLAYGDDPLQCVDVWRPAGRAAAPAVLMIHGGCWRTAVARRDIMNWIADDLRRHGVGVWNVEYRGVDRGGGHPGTYLDVGRAADLFRERAAGYGLKADRTIVVGHSAGGHLALWLANRPALPAGETLRGDDPIGIDLAIGQGGLPDLRAAAARTGHPCGAEAPRRMAGPDLTRTSPPEMNPGHARQVLFHNALDHVAPPAHAREYVARMAARNVAVSLVETPAEGHVELVAPGSVSWARQRTLVLDEAGLS